MGILYKGESMKIYVCKLVDMVGAYEYDIAVVDLHLEVFEMYCEQWTSALIEMDQALKTKGSTSSPIDEFKHTVSSIMFHRDNHGQALRSDIMMMLLDTEPDSPIKGRCEEIEFRLSALQNKRPFTMDAMNIEYAVAYSASEARDLYDVMIKDKG